MSSNYRAVGEAHLHLYQSIPADPSTYSWEEAVRKLMDIREEAKNDYDTYARFMGWQEIADIEKDEAEQEAEEQSRPGFLKLWSIRARLFWVEQKGITTDDDFRFTAYIELETASAYLVRSGEVLAWLPRSIIMDMSEVPVE